MRVGRVGCACGMRRAIWRMHSRVAAVPVRGGGCKYKVALRARRAGTMVDVSWGGSVRGTSMPRRASRVNGADEAVCAHETGSEGQTECAGRRVTRVSTDRAGVGTICDVGVRQYVPLAVADRFIVSRGFFDKEPNVRLTSNMCLCMCLSAGLCVCPVTRPPASLSLCAALCAVVVCGEARAGEAIGVGRALCFHE